MFMQLTWSKMLNFKKRRKIFTRQSYKQAKIGAIFKKNWTWCLLQSDYNIFLCQNPSASRQSSDPRL